MVSESWTDSVLMARTEKVPSASPRKTKGAPLTEESEVT